MKVYKYRYSRRCYDGTWIIYKGIVFAPDEEVARQRVTNEHLLEGEIELEETYVVPLE